jgi:hypothetical protein
MNEPLPSNWDWVTARHRCSAVKVFESLRVAAQENVETMNALRSESTGAWTFTSLENSFSIVRRLLEATIGVKFALDEETISVENYHQANNFEVNLNLNDDGECRFFVKGETGGLDRWQLLRRALEPAFFGPIP